MISRSSLFEYTVGALFFAAVGFSLGQSGVMSGGGMLAEVMSAGCTATVTYRMHPSTPFFNDYPENSTGVTMGVASFRADEAAVLTGLSVNINGPRDSFGPGTNLSVWDGATKVGAVRVHSNSASPTFYVPISNVQLLANTDKSLMIRADLGPTSHGDKLVANITNVSAYTVRNSASAISSGSTNFVGVSTHANVPIITTFGTSTRVAQNGVNELATVDVTAPANLGNILIEKLTFEVATTTAMLNKFMLVGPTGQVSSTTLYYKPGTRLIIATFDNLGNKADRIINSGTTKRYVLRATDVVLVGNMSSGSVTTVLKADAAYKYGRQGLQTGYKNDQFVVWSSSSTTPNGVDWANSYGLPGCFLLTSNTAADCPAGTIAK